MARSYERIQGEMFTDSIPYLQRVHHQRNNSCACALPAHVEKNVLGYVILYMWYVCLSLTGLKLASRNQYDSLVEKSFHVSHAVLEPSGQGRVEVHIVLHKVDYIVCILSETCPQQPLNLEISEGEEMTVYVKTTSQLEACVHLTGYHVEESIDHQWEEDDEQWNEEELSSGEGVSSEEEEDQEVCVI